MKKLIQFSKFFVPAVIISGVLILGGVVSFCIQGINFGIDFKPGMIESVQIAPTAIELSYVGSSTVSVEADAQGIDLIITGVGSANETRSFGYIDYATVGDMVKAMNTVEGVTAKAKADSGVAAQGFFGSSAESATLTSSAYRLHYIPENPKAVSVDEVRGLFAGMNDYSVKQTGTESENTFQIRAGDDGSDEAASKNIQDTILAAFTAKYGADNVVVSQTDFVGSQFSKSLASKSIWLAVITLALIWVYAAIRFKWDFALGAIIALIHDSLIMIAFISVTQMEFTSTTLAAILTIIGYSINATVVILDRVRENIRIIKFKKFTEVLNISLSETLSRSIITTVTTMLAVGALYIFTSGSMKDFALALLIGMLSGAYSSIFISSSFIALTRKNWKPSDEEKSTQTVKAEDYTADLVTD